MADPCLCWSLPCFARVSAACSALVMPDWLTPGCTLLQGETFFTAARHATDLLTRNFLKAYGVWWFPPMVVQCAAFLLSVAWGLVTFLTAWLVWRHQSGNSGQQASHC